MERRGTIVAHQVGGARDGVGAGRQAVAMATEITTKKRRERIEAALAVLVEDRAVMRDVLRQARADRVKKVLGSVLARIDLEIYRLRKERADIMKGAGGVAKEKKAPLLAPE